MPDKPEQLSLGLKEAPAPAPLPDPPPPAKPYPQLPARRLSDTGWQNDGGYRSWQCYKRVIAYSAPLSVSEAIALEAEVYRAGLVWKMSSHERADGATAYVFTYQIDSGD